MDLNLLLLFVSLYFLRPQDWIPQLSGAPLVSLVMLAAILATATRAGGFSLRQVLRTPHDWLMGLYFGWVIYTADAPFGMFKKLLPFMVFYVVTVLALTSIPNLGRFLRWWCGLLVVLAAAGVMTAFGIDFTGASEKILINQGRLVLNTYMHNNPNALGHSVVVALPMAWFLYFWRTGAILKGALFSSAVFLCVLYTQSKGAFLVGFVVLVLALMFGQPRVFQIIIGSLAALGGGAILSMLPRMAELSKSEQGIQGRVLAWNSAWESLQQFPRGVGWNNFFASFMWEGELVVKATHSSYVQIGAALGYVGLFLYVGVIYSWFRTLLLVRPATIEQDRLRRVLFVLASASALSNWMIDRAYHTEFFLLTAAVGAYHRLVAGARRSEPMAESAETEQVPHQLPAPAYAGPGLTPQPAFSIAAGIVAAGTARSVFLQPGTDSRPNAEDAPETLISRFVRWPRLMLIDLPLIYLGYRLVLETWEYVIRHF